jgi:uncharacterized membrane protein YGL010W
MSKEKRDLLIAKGTILAFLLLGLAIIGLVLDKVDLSFSQVLGVAAGIFFVYLSGLLQGMLTAVLEQAKG